MFSYKHDVILYSDGMTTKIRILTLILYIPYYLIHRTHSICAVAPMIFFVAKGFNLGPCVKFSPFSLLQLRTVRKSFLECHNLTGSHLLKDWFQFLVPVTYILFCILYLYLYFVFVHYFVVFTFIVLFLCYLLHLYWYLYCVFLWYCLIKSDTY